MVVIAAVAVSIAAYVAADPSAAPGTWPGRFIVTLLLAGVALFVVAGVRRLILDSKAVDDHPGQEVPLIRDSAGHVIESPTLGSPGMKKGLEALQKDLIDDGRPESRT
jgi:hypothetical protein